MSQLRHSPATVPCKMTIHADKAEVAARLLKLYESTANPQFRRQCLKMITSLTTPTVNSSSSTSAVGGGITRCKTAKGDDRKRSKVSIDLEAQKQSVSKLIEGSELCSALYLEEEWRKRHAYQTSYQRQFSKANTFSTSQLGQPLSSHIVEEPLQPTDPAIRDRVKCPKEKMAIEPKHRKALRSSRLLPRVPTQPVSRYGEEFYEKGFQKVQPIRSASGSGQRRNNPQTKLDFMSWKHAKQRNKNAEVSYDVTARTVPSVHDIVVYRATSGAQSARQPSKRDEYQSGKTDSGDMNHPAARPNTARHPFKINDSKVENAIKHKTRSIYQVDYLGAPQGVNLRTAFFDVTDLNETGDVPRPPRTVDTNSRISYGKPNKQPAPLRPNTSRYGCNSTFHIPAMGVVPLVSEGDVDMSSLGDRGARTTYSREYNHKRPFTAPGSRFGARPGTLQNYKCGDVNAIPTSADLVDENGVELNKEEVFKRARGARVNESLTYRKSILKPTVVSIRQPFSQWAGPS